MFNRGRKVYRPRSRDQAHRAGLTQDKRHERMLVAMLAHEKNRLLYCNA